MPSNEPVQAYGDRVVVVRSETDEKTPGGVYLPDTTRENQRIYRGTIVSVGQGRTSDKGLLIAPLGLTVGDVIYFSPYAASKIEIRGETYYVVETANVLAFDKS